MMNWWTETLKYIWRAKNISVGLFWWHSPSRPVGFSTWLCAQTGVCRLLLQDPQQATQDVSDVSVSCWSSDLFWHGGFGCPHSAWPECRHVVFFLSQELQCECTAGMLHLWPSSGHRMRLWPARNNTFQRTQCGCWVLCTHCLTAALHCAALLSHARAAHGNYKSVSLESLGSVSDSQGKK